ncbi:MAG TPA: DUF2157 domain-containing protein [Acidimicrobiales bacterium]|nr:DUF2157 domain-containing protein [Acidimicrobiales bacterium]
MFSIGLLVLVLVAVYAVTRRGGAHPARPAPDVDRLSSWVAAGLLSEAQAVAIRAHEAQAAPAVRARQRVAGERAWRLPSVAEPLGYLGGVLAVVGLLLVISRFWPDMGTASRLAMSAGAMLACLGGAALLHEPAEAALVRLRWSLWLAATAAAGLFGGIAVGDGFGADEPKSVVLAVAGAVALLSTALWRGLERPVQQATALAGGITAVGAAVAHLDSHVGTGAAVALAGAAVLYAGIRRLTSIPPLSAAVGAVAVAVGSQILAVERPALQLVGVAAAFVLLALPSLPQLRPRLEHRIAGTVGLLLLVTAGPGTLGHFAQGAGVATGMAVWAVGGALLALGVRDLVERAPVVEVAGGLTMLGGAALTGVGSTALAPLLGIATAVGLLALGAWSEELRHSVLGALGLLVHVPWAIGRYFPGEGRVPLLIMVAGVLVLGLAVLLARHGDRTPRTPHMP